MVSERWLVSGLGSSAFVGHSEISRQTTFYPRTLCVPGSTSGSSLLRDCHRVRSEFSRKGSFGNGKEGEKFAMEGLLRKIVRSSRRLTSPRRESAQGWRLTRGSQLNQPKPGHALRTCRKHSLRRARRAGLSGVHSFRTISTACPSSAMSSDEVVHVPFRMPSMRRPCSANPPSLRADARAWNGSELTGSRMTSTWGRLGRGFQNAGRRRPEHWLSYDFAA